MAAPGANIRPIVLNVNLPETRGAAIALVAALDDLGKGLGPFLVGQLSIWLHSRRLALNWSIAGWLPCGVLLLLTSFTIPRDSRRMQEKLQEQVERALQ